MMKLAVLQRLIRAGDQDPRSTFVTREDVWEIAKSRNGDHLELDPGHFVHDLIELFEMELKKYDKPVPSFWNKDRVKRIDEIYTAEEATAALKAAWNRLTRRIKAETIKVV